MTDITDPALPDTAPAVASASPGPTAAPQAAEAAPAAIPTAENASRPASPVYAAEWPKITHTLAHPILLAAGAEPIRVIEIPEPDLETMERVLGAIDELGLTAEDEIKLGVKQLRPLLAAFTGIPDATLKRIHFKDVNALAEKLGPLLEGLAT